MSRTATRFFNVMNDDAPVESWTGIGGNVDNTMTADTIRTVGGLDWSVVEQNLVTVSTTVSPMLPVEGYKALSRSDNHRILSVVSDTYKVVQPETIVQFYKNFIDKNGFKMHAVGSTGGGKRLWAYADVGAGFTVKGNDQVGMYLLFATSYDRTLSTIVKLTSIRVVCMNTLHAALRDESDFSVKIRHASEFDAVGITLNLEGLEKQTSDFAEKAKALSARIVSRDEAVRFFVDTLYPDTPEIELTQRKQTKLAQVFNLFENGRGQREAGQTAWGLVNAVTLMVDHINGRSADNAFNSAQFGAGAKMKAEAFSRALKLVA